MSRRNNSLISKVGKCIRRSRSITSNIKIIPDTYKSSRISSESQLSELDELDELNELNEFNTIISYPNRYHYFPKAMVVVVESLAVHKVPELSKKRWGYVNVPSSNTNSEESNIDNIDQEDSITSEQKKKMKRWGFVAPIVGIPKNFPIFDSNPSPIKRRFYYYI
ncbi:uncharacterized protein OCT59_020264 [Rhizophagus irregularis]|uniref:Uncharacterized protein n=3 Tax=Rhizophagus irregularis TaxID=588596 RepID=A0A916EGS3_9GLOM|nr:hypothetical protein OCT59_020264 [Rhizophagus irregularis]GBC25948.1 hypothetical protein GLOIN_2v349399 [Rhizophagus irregularis DAOM 181602=DAOM 197198]CAB4474656.1 unnamed protein product [Rhizophagus irregularis]CAB5156657.1 unnamed protein product [Rhizophagus irregularis]CAB5386245.1 unnamed protein product [Rhizophagus irregularis]